MSNLSRITVFCVPLFILITAGIVAKTSSVQSQVPGNSSPGRSRAAPRTASEQQAIDAYRKTNEAVVNITTQTTTPEFFGFIYQEGSGSGVVVDAQKGLIVTNSHVISNARQIAVTLANGKSYPVRLVGVDRGNEIALLRIKAPQSELVSAELGDSSSLEVGQRVLAIGNPFGLQRTLTTGIISSLGRAIRSEDGRLIEDLIQTDAAINPGNSGGPLLDTAGRVVGLNTAILSRTGESAGIGFAIPVNQIKRALPQLIKYGRVLRPKIGVLLEDTKYGPAIVYVVPDSPADKVGMQGARAVRRGLSGYYVDLSQADFILKINGAQVVNKEEAVSALGKSDPNKKVTLLLRRGLNKTKVREVRVRPVLE